MNTSILSVAMVFAGLVIGTALAEAAQPNNGATVIQNFNNAQASDTADNVAGVNEDDNDDQGADNDDQGGDHDGQGAGSDNQGGDHENQGGDNDGQGGDHDGEGGDGQ
jgi:hypothetical protein